MIPQKIGVNLCSRKNMLRTLIKVKAIGQSFNLPELPEPKDGLDGPIEDINQIKQIFAAEETLDKNSENLGPSVNDLTTSDPATELIVAVTYADSLRLNALATAKSHANESAQLKKKIKKAKGLLVNDITIPDPAAELILAVKNQDSLKLEALAEAKSQASKIAQLKREIKKVRAAQAKLKQPKASKKAKLSND